MKGETGNLKLETGADGDRKLDVLDYIRQVTPNEIELAQHRFKQIKELVADLLELVLDGRSEDPCWKDPARRYCELRNEAVRLGLREGTLIELEEPKAAANGGL
jgi:hypothetical protein